MKALFLFLLLAACAIAAPTGSTITFVVSGISGSPPYAYQWRKANPSGVPVNIYGAIGATYVIPKAQTSDTGSYSLTIDNGGVPFVTNAVWLTVDPAPLLSGTISFSVTLPNPVAPPPAPAPTPPRP